MATTLMPGGTGIVTETVDVPTPRVARLTFATRVDVSRALRAAVSPPSVTVTLRVDRTYTWSDLAPCWTTPTVKLRVEVWACKWMTTTIGVATSAVTPLGRSRAMFTETSLVAPATEIG